MFRLTRRRRRSRMVWGAWAFTVCLGVHAVRAQSGSPVERGSSFMRFKKPVLENGQPESERPHLPGEVEPSWGPLAAAKLRARLWAQGSGPSGPIRSVSGSSDWCAAGVCPLLDRVDAALDAHDYPSANETIAGLRARINVDVADPCDRIAGQAALNQLECEANPESWAGHDPIFCVTRPGDPGGPRAGNSERCNDRACEDPVLMARMAGTFRGAVCAANNLPADGRKPRIHFALEMNSCRDGVPEYPPMLLEHAGVMLVRDHTTVDGYTLPGATPGNVLLPRAPSHLPVLSSRPITEPTAEVSAALAVFASDSVISGLEFRDTIGEASMAVSAGGPRGGSCERGGRNDWLRGNVFGGGRRAALFVSGLSRAVGRNAESIDLTGIVIGMRADRPDPTDGNLFRGRQSVGIYLGRGRNSIQQQRFGWVRGAEIRGNWFRSESNQPSVGIVSDESAGEMVECNRFENLAGAIAIETGHGAKVRRNWIEGTPVGIKVLGGASRVTIGGGASEAGPPKDPLRGSCPVQSMGNRIVAAENGVTLEGDVADVTVAGNQLEENRGAAISVQSSAMGEVPTSVRIEGNDIRDSDAGVRVTAGEPTVVGNRIRGSRGFALQVYGGELAERRPAGIVRPVLGSAVQPNVLDDNGAGGILLVDAVAANQDRLELDNRLTRNGDFAILQAWHTAVRVVERAPSLAPVPGVAVEVSGNHRSFPMLSGVSDDQGWVGPKGFKLGEPASWFLFPEWGLASPLGGGDGGDPRTRSHRELFLPQQVRLVRAGNTSEVEIAVTGRSADVGSAVADASGSCAGGSGDACEGGVIVHHRVNLTAP